MEYVHEGGEVFSVVNVLFDLVGFELHSKRTVTCNSIERAFSR